MFCNNCGKQIPDDAKFCDYCGTPIVKNNMSYSDQTGQLNQSGQLYNTGQLNQTGQLQGGQFDQNVQLQKQGRNSGPIAAIIAVTAVILIAILCVLLFVTPGWLKKDDNSSKRRRDKTTEEVASTDTTESTTMDSDEKIVAAAESFSTDKTPIVTDFEWYTSGVRFDGPQSEAEYITDYRLAEGGWKMMMITDPYWKLDSYSERYMNCTIHTENETNVTVSLKWWCMSSPDSDTIEETDRGVDELTGYWSGKQIKAESDRVGRITITDIYKVGENQFAIGTFEWVDGTFAQIAMIRPGENNIIYTPTENYVDYRPTTEATTEATTQATTQAKTEATTQSPPKQEPTTQAKSSGNKSTDAILAKAKAWAGTNSAVVDGAEGDSIIIRCYDDMGDHQATSNYLTIDPGDLTGYDFYGNPVDLNPY